MAKNFKKRDRISIWLRMSFKRRQKVLKEAMTVGRQTNAGGLMRAELPRKQKPESAQNLSELASDHRRPNHSQRKRKGF